MRKIMTLVSIEINRIFKFLIAILGLYAVIQTIYTIVFINNVKSSLIYTAKQYNLTLEQFLNSNDYNLYTMLQFVQNNATVLGGVAVCILVVIYGFIIWYREWFGNHKVIYTLMMLPINRMKIYISKFITMLLIIFSMLSTFVIVQAINYKLVKYIIPQSNNVNISFMSYVYGNKYLSFIPTNILEFLVYVSAIFVVISIIFLFVHLEISYKFKGAVLGVILAIAYLGILFLLLTTNNILIKEKIWLITLYNVITICISGTISRFLLKDKITV
jgi:hypothetical protein